MQSRIKRDDCRSLITAYVDGQISDDAFAELERILAHDPEAMQEYLDYIDIHVGLVGWAKSKRNLVDQQSPFFVSPRSTLGQFTQSRRKYGLVLAATASILLLAVGLRFWFANDGRNRQADLQKYVGSPPPQKVEVATLIRARGCNWADGVESVVEGERLTTGSLHLEEGDALLKFDGGAELILVGPANIELLSLAKAKLVSGMGTVRAPDVAIGFQLITPSTVVVDLGTEFGVSVNSTGATEVHVFDGEVECAPSNPTAEFETPSLLQGGVARRFKNESDADGESILIAHSGFQRDFGVANEIGHLHGKLFAYEPFDYDTKQLGTGNGGFGWSTGWRRRGGTKGIAYSVAPESLERPADAVTASGGHLNMFGSKGAERRLQKPVDLSKNGVYYLSCRLLLSDAVPQEPPGRLTVLLRSGVGSGHSAGVGWSVSKTDQLFAVNNGHNSVSSFPIDRGETMLIVTKIISAEHSPDQILVKAYRTNQPVDLDEPENWTLAGRAAGSDLLLSRIQMLSRRGTEYRIDELRIGSTWRSVTSSKTDSK